MMKTMRRALSIIAALAAVLVLPSCSHSEPETGGMDIPSAGQAQQGPDITENTGPQPTGQEQTSTTVMTNADGDVEVQLSFEVPTDYPQALPTVGVEPHRITSEEARQFAKAVLGEVDFYETSMDPAMTQAEAEATAAKWEKLMDMDLLTDLYGEGQAGQVRDSIRQRIESLDGLIQSPAGDGGRQSCQWEFRPQAYYLPAAMTGGDAGGSPDTIMAHAEKDGLGYMVWATDRTAAGFTVQDIHIFIDPQFSSPNDVETLHMIRTACGHAMPTEEDMAAAREKAQGIIDTMGMGAWTIADSRVNMCSNWYNWDSPAYVTTVTAVPSYDGSEILHFDQQEYIGEGAGTNYYYTQLKLCFSASGQVVEAKLSSPLDYAAEESPASSLIGQQQAMDILEQYISTSSPATWDKAMGSMAGSSIKGVIDDMRVGLARINARDGSGGYLLVPAVQFNGDYSLIYDGTEQYTYSQFFGKCCHFATINLLDGSMIDPQRGY